MDPSILHRSPLSRPDRPCIALALVLLCGTSPSAVVAEPTVGPQPDLVGLHAIVDTRSGTVLRSARVEVSERGMRVSNLFDGRQSVMNYALGRYWFVDRARRLVHEVPVRVTATETSPIDGTDTSGRNGRVISGVFSARPCSGMRVGGSTVGRWRGRSVAIVECLDPSGNRQATHFHSDELGMVIRTLSGDGLSSEFRDIEPLELDDSRFVPPLYYTSVDLVTFGRAGEPIGRYVDPATQSQAVVSEALSR